MSDTSIVDQEIVERDLKTGRFLPGNSGFGGRPKGSRNKLGEAFIEDLAETWRELGTDALRRCAKDEPGVFCKIVASLLPRDVHLQIGINFAEMTSREEVLAAVIEEKGEQAALLIEQFMALDAKPHDIKS